jgi:hypothetical protein
MIAFARWVKTVGARLFLALNLKEAMTLLNKLPEPQPEAKDEAVGDLLKERRTSK